MRDSKDLEIEIKIRLESFTDYLKLIGFLGSIDEEVRHTNAFFDTEDRKFGEAGYALRVRAGENRGLVTVKSLISQSESMSVRREIESEVESGHAHKLILGHRDPFEMDIEPIRFLQEKFDRLSLTKLVQFENVRQKKKFRIGDYEYILEIDKTEFTDGTVDYELEIELADQGQYDVVVDRIRKMFNSLGIPFEKQSQSKYARALEHAALT